MTVLRRAHASISSVWTLLRRGLSSSNLAPQVKDQLQFDVPQDKIRNFAIIAHIDHGKSTLADRLLELTGAIPTGGRKQFLDKLPVERARGITVKAQSAALRFNGHVLNLIDTPGHVDFGFEVARSLSACQGAVLLVDATQGIQAQTLATYHAAFDAELAIIPVINKVDMPLAEPQRVQAQMVTMFGVEPADILQISAKTGLGVQALLEALVDRIPPPAGQPDGAFRALLLDSHYDSYRGAINLVQVADGSVGRGDRFESCLSGDAFEVLEVGLLVPESLPLIPPLRLRAGQSGYIISDARSVRSARVGDTFRGVKSAATPLQGFSASKPMVFQGLFPASSDDYEALKAAVERLCINDPSVVLVSEKSQALGPGFNAGFLGLLHADVFCQRLKDEYGADVISTVPTVPYRVVLADGSVTAIRSPSELPDAGKLRGGCLEEPMVNVRIIAPKDAVGALVQLCVERRGVQLEHTFLDEHRAMLRYFIPMGEMAVDFADVLKRRSTGYASFDYEPAGYQAADIVRLDLLINGEPVDALATLVHRDKATRAGREMASRLKELLGRQMYDVAIQAAVGGKVIARESLSAMRKNVIAKCYGGDITRKRKLLEKQKEGKKKMKAIGSVEVPHEIFSQLLRSDEK